MQDLYTNITNRFNMDKEIQIIQYFFLFIP